MGSVGFENRFCYLTATDQAKHCGTEWACAQRPALSRLVLRARKKRSRSAQRLNRPVRWLAILLSCVSVYRAF